MIGKCFLAVICFSLAQVHGVELEAVIGNGLNRVEALYEKGNLRVQEAIRESEGKSNLIRTTTESLLAKSQNLQETTQNNLRATARASEEVATVQNRPASTLRCIANAEKNAINHIGSVNTKYTGDIERLEKTKLANIDTASKPLAHAAGDLTVRYTRAVNQIRLCKTTLCVENAVNSCSVWVDKLFSDIDRALSLVATAYSNYERDSTLLTDNSSIQIVSTETVGIRQIEICVRD